MSQLVFFAGRTMKNTKQCLYNNNFFFAKMCHDGHEANLKDVRFESCEEKWVILMFAVSSFELSMMIRFTTLLAKARGDRKDTDTRSSKIMMQQGDLRKSQGRKTSIIVVHNMFRML